MQPPMTGPSGPKTVTFNADSRTEAQHRSAELGARVVTRTLGLASIVLAGVALVFNLRMAHAVAGSWGELAVLASIALGLTLALAGLQVAEAVISRAYPGEAWRATLCWTAALVMTALGGLFFVFDGAGGYVLTPAEAGRVAELRRAIRVLSQAEMATWRRSANCTEPQSAADRQTCNAIHGRDETYRAEIAAIEAGPLPGVLRRLLILALALAAAIGAGLLGRLAVIASAESWRLGEGTASPDPGGALPTGGLPDVTAAVSPADIFSMWANQRLRPNDAASVISEAAYQDYVETARLNGVLPISLNEFGKLLRARAEASEGRVIRTKIAGKMTYRGWQLVTDLAEARGEPAGFLAGPGAG